MKQTHEYWWSDVKGMIRNYPALKSQYRQDLQLSLFQNKEPVPHLDCNSLKIKRKEYHAVDDAIKATMKYKDGAERLKMIQYVFWDKTGYNIAGAALKIHCSERTAQEWHRIFIRTVAKNFGLLD